jgi:hypothetical protein
MSDSIHQMTAEYNAVHDRILFRVNTLQKIEYRVWLTRRAVKTLWGVAVKSFEAVPEVTTLAEPRVRKAIMSMQHQEAVQTSNFKEKHVEGGMPPPDLSEPPLATGIRIKRSAATVTLTFATVEGKAISLNFNDQMLHALVHILQGASDKAGWDLKLAVGDGTQVQRSAAAVLH